MLAHRPGADRHPVAEPRLVGRLLGAAPVALELPAVIEAAQRVALDAPSGELRAAVWTACLDQMRLAAVAAIKRVALAHNPQRDRTAARQVGGVIDRIPERPQI